MYKHTAQCSGWEGVGIASLSTVIVLRDFITCF